jgi:hypothetical protein
MQQKLSQETIEKMRTPAGWCRALVLDPAHARFYREQEADMNLPHDVLIYCKRKSRRCGWSHSLTRRAVAMSHIFPDTATYFVSMNLADAYKKIEECEKFYHEIHPDGRLPIIANNRTSLRFQHGKASYSEIVATFRPRGMPGKNLQIIVDEADHILDLQATLQAAIPNIVQGHSQLLVGGSVYRDHGPFWDLFNLDLSTVLNDEAAKLLQGHIRKSELFWWQVPWLLKKEYCKGYASLDKVAIEAALMDTRTRVLTFGSDRLKLTFATMALEDFQQEFELRAIKEGVALIPWEVILKCSADPEMELATTIEDCMLRIHDGGLSPIAGYDVGYRSNSSELTIYGYDEKNDFATETYAETFTRKELPDQREYLRALLNKMRSLVLVIDAGGIGADMAATLEREFPNRVISVEFDYYAKLGIFDAFAERMIRGRMKNVADAERRRQINSIKRKTTEAGRVIYYVARKEKHHADIAVSQALAVYGITMRAIAAPFEIYTSGGKSVDSKREIDELGGSHDEFVREVVNA